MRYSNDDKNIDIQNHERLVDYLPEDDPLTKPVPVIVKRFLEKIRAIHEAGKKQYLYPSEMIIMINRNYGYKTWRQIPWGRMEEMREFIINNAKNCLKIIDPDLAGKLENYDPTNDQTLLLLEKWCPGLVNDLLHATYKKSLQPRTEY
jgi:hypothetical protein